MIMIKVEQLSSCDGSCDDRTSLSRGRVRANELRDPAAGGKLTKFLLMQLLIGGGLVSAPPPSTHLS